MKRTIFTMIAALAVFSCAKMEVYPEAGNDTRNYVISGSFGQQTKTSITSTEENPAKVVWSLGDKIGIFSEENPNAMALLEDPCDGKTNGSFVPQDAIPEGMNAPVSFVYPASGKSEFLVYYPYNGSAKMDMSTSTLVSSIDENQMQDKLGDLSIGKYGFSYGLTTVSAEESKVNFNLTHAMAYVCVRAKYGDDDDFQLHSVQFMEQSGNYPLSGAFTFDSKSRTIAATTNSKYSVKAEIVSHDFTTVPSSEEVYLTLFPGNYTKATLKTIVSFVNSKGVTITIPIDSDKGWKFKEGALSILNLGTIHKSDCSIPWYDVEDTRDLLGGWAYGPQNTYFIESKGAGQGVTKLTFSVKARGDFAKVKEPVYYGLITAGGEHKTHTKFLMLEDGSDSQDAVSGGQFVPSESHRVGSDYTITVSGLDQSMANGTFAVLAIYDKDKNLIWSYMLQRWRDYDPPVDVEYPALGVKLLDRALGQANGNANLKGDLNSYCAFFQWGRKDAFPFVTESLPNWGKASAPAEASLEYSITHPSTLFLSTSDTPTWMGKSLDSGLWGGKIEGKDWYDPDYVGHKTIYDPCPEGYRVCDTRVLNEVYKNASRWERTSVIKKYHSGADAAYTHDTGWGGSELSYDTGNGRDYWLYGGYLFDNQSRVRTSSDSGYSYWGNAICPSDGYPSCLLGYYTTNWAKGTTGVPCSAMAVRCQKEN